MDVRLTAQADGVADARSGSEEPRESRVGRADHVWEYDGAIDSTIQLNSVRQEKT